jgi:hypothetical protein
MSESKVPKFFKQGVIVLLILAGVFLLILAIFNNSRGNRLLDTSSVSGWFTPQDSVPQDSTVLDSTYSDSLKVVK